MNMIRKLKLKLRWSFTLNFLGGNHHHNFSHFLLRISLSRTIPVKNVTLYIFLCLFAGRLVENEPKSNGNPIIFLANTKEIPWLELVQNPYHVPAWKTNKTWINDISHISWNLESIWTKLPPNQVELWFEITWNFHGNPHHIFYRTIILSIL